MTPIEHYREAERLLAKAAEVDPKRRGDYLLQTAQVHATLANAHMTAGVWGDEDES